MLPKKLNSLVMLRLQKGIPYDEFFVGVFDEEYGPFVSEDGAFSVQMPLNDKYSILIWGINRETFKLYGEVRADLTDKEGEYSLGTLGGFPKDLGLLEGTVKDEDETPIRGYVEVAGQIVPIKSDGTFQLKNIPLGKITLKVFGKTPDGKGPELYKEDITVYLNAPTSKDIFVVK